MQIAVDVVVFLVGVALVVVAMRSAVTTVILPRAVASTLSRRVFLAVRTVFRWRIGRRAPYEKHDHVMALYGPVSLLTLLVTWLVLTLFGFMGMFYAVGVRAPRDAFTLSGSSLLTLGFARDASLPSTILSFTEATIGLVLLALLITYLPTIYSAFQRREQVVAMLETRGGLPVSGVAMVELYARIEGLERLAVTWTRFETWFVDVEESHTSLPVLAFFRSPQPLHSWITSAGAILDAAALVVSCTEGGRKPEPQLMMRAGFIALQRIATFLRIPIDADPKPTDPISITRAEFDEAFDRLAAADLPMRADRDAAWVDFAGWRVNYDMALVRLAALVVAPPAPWSSDAARLPPDQYGKIKGLFKP